ncbi:MAG: DNA-binding protein WhiA [Anaerococcus sp.]|uniref:DNA-binding protein WhiA n=1 Tax=Anaerococcus sp. TaxID=1872515 RepID=UPI00261D0B8A|nr:DNA-binding protein WhiA [Anaerococcus sp.]MCI5971524.1 DNA-binding protein WhiA [Anaerococcus sp.]MDD6919256.1 DNA-binding protein WhiA [Peptoniphilaceae bacterium]MDY2927907.1 DNA-binding protein WhiA [Anaerococcus sp.]
MSFSKRCKKEVLKKEPISKMGELLSIIHFIGSIRINMGGYNIKFETESNSYARYIYNLIKDLYDYSSTFEIFDKSFKDKDRIFTVLVEDNDISEDLINKKTEGFIDNFNDIEDVSLDEIKSFLKIAFIYKGSINDPQRGYNLEIIAREENELKLIKESMDTFDLNAKINDRGDYYIVYIKDSDKISDFLAIIGANKSLFELENVRAMKSIRNDINRQTNFDKANIDRTVKASLRQVDAIKAVINSEEYDKLSEDMKEIASIRIDNPYISIEEIGQMMDPVMSKAKVNYRLQKFIKLAEDL